MAPVKQSMGKVTRKAVAAKVARKIAAGSGGVKKPRRERPLTPQLPEIRRNQEELARETAETFKNDLIYFENLCANYRKCVPTVIYDVKIALEITEQFKKDACIFKKMCAFYPNIYDKLQNNYE